MPCCGQIIDFILDTCHFSNLFMQGKTFSHWLFSHVALCTHIISTHIEYTKYIKSILRGKRPNMRNIIASVYEQCMAIHIKYKWQFIWNTNENKIKQCKLQSTICSNGSLKFLRDLFIEQKIYGLLFGSLFKCEYTVWCLNCPGQCIPKDTTIVYKWPSQSGWVMARYLYI